ncbi:major facilitator superfamily domain-containing protein [Xylaria acuta]|nr:major facilitator superfamily domain-containing protein [Xylaria acuta]
MLVVREKAAQGNTGLPRGTRRHQTRDLLNLERLRKQYGAPWDGPDDPKNSYSFSSTRKHLAASVTAAALGDISRDLGLDPATAQISFSIHGRRNIWITSNVWFILWNSLCPVGYSKSLMIAGRFLAALGASVRNTLAGPAMTDMFYEKDRGKSLALAGLLPYLGPAPGPIIGGLVSQLMDWPWLFYIVILRIVMLLIGVFMLPEAYTPVLLRRKAILGQFYQEVIDGSPTTTGRWAFWRDFFSRLGVNMLRPVQILLYRAVMHVMTLNMGLDFGIYTLVLSTFAQLYQAACTISISIGIPLVTQGGGLAMDWVYRSLRGRDGPKNKSSPCTDLQNQPVIPGILPMPTGLFWYGWSAQYHYHWIVVDIGAAYAQALNAYIPDEFRKYAASASAALRVLSQILGSVFPIFAPKLHGTLGYGWGNSALAFIFIVLAFPVPGCLWLLGEKLRALGTHFIRMLDALAPTLS